MTGRIASGEGGKAVDGCGTRHAVPGRAWGVPLRQFAWRRGVPLRSAPAAFPGGAGMRLAIRASFHHRLAAQVVRARVAERPLAATGHWRRSWRGRGRRWLLRRRTPRRHVALWWWCSEATSSANGLKSWQWADFPPRHAVPGPVSVRPDPAVCPPARRVPMLHAPNRTEMRPPPYER
jgi:hypothetical protein